MQKFNWYHYRWAWSLFIFLLILLIGYQYEIKSQLCILKKLQHKINSLQDKISKDFIQKKDSLKAISIHAPLFVDARLLSEKVISDLQPALQKSGITWKTVQFVEPLENKYMNSARVHLEGIGTYEKLLQLIANLPYQKYAIQMNKFKIILKKEETLDLTLDLFIVQLKEKMEGMKFCFTEKSAEMKIMKLKKEVHFIKTIKLKILNEMKVAQFTEKLGSPFCVSPSVVSKENHLSLSAVSIQEMKMVGFLSFANLPQAILLLPDRTSQVVRLGMQIGKERATVIHISKKVVQVALPTKTISSLKLGE